jgi:tRNA-splicing ligase RtcB (3'-phosphate/5'-hydroxy nucleic acid ligase)
MIELKKISKDVYEIPKQGKMLVPSVILASEKLIEKIKQDKTLEQAMNISMLPGIVEKSITMPDAHQGYGFPIGGVAAFDLKKGIISPGGVGYDINCGVRLLKTNLTKKEFLEKREKILDELYKNIPSGVGVGGELKISEKEMNELLEQGVEWTLKRGFATKDDIDKIEDRGCIKNSDAKKVSQKAKARGKNQLGTIGSGNHFIEVQYVDEIFDKKTAEVFGLKKEGITILIHTGSRGLGHQTASDYIHKMEREFGIENLPDRELVYAPLESQLAQDYIQAMNASANFAFANRQIITYNIRKSFEKFFPNAKIKLVYDVTHNIAKFEPFKINGKKMDLCVHRKGATRAFGKGRKEIPKEYQKVGQPVLIPGSMGTASYVLLGTRKAEEFSFASTAHGAGRLMSRARAKEEITESSLKKELEESNVKFRAGSIKDLLEEAPKAYKDIEEVVRIVDELGISKKVARLRPLMVVKG